MFYMYCRIPISKHCFFVYQKKIKKHIISSNPHLFLRHISYFLAPVYLTMMDKIDGL